MQRKGEVLNELKGEYFTSQKKIHEMRKYFISQKKIQEMIECV